VTNWAEVRTRPHYVYRLLNCRGRVLYVGCTSNLSLRMSEYRRFLAVRGRRAEHIGPYDFETARRIERALIRLEDPPTNIEWTPRHVRGRSPYKTYAAA
jgi:hypothetical protein